MEPVSRMSPRNLRCRIVGCRLQKVVYVVSDQSLFTSIDLNRLTEP